MLSKSKIRDIYDGAWNGTPLAADENHEALHDAGLRAVEAAVRADQAVECSNARFELLRGLAAAQAVIAEAQARLHAASIPPGMSEGQFNAITILDTRRILAQPYAAIVAEPSTPEQATT